MQTLNDIAPKRPVIALMGEFSSGKSTLANLLIGEEKCTVKVTATQLPPIWFSHGEGAPYAVDVSGNSTQLAPGQLETLSLETTSYVKMFIQSEILELADIIDMPGISDPNMSSEVWQRAIGHADLVLWCTHATQAWRQSEAAVWAEVDDRLYENSLLLLTRYDKLLTDSDRRRVVKRVTAETDGMFKATYPISLVQALTAGDDRLLWEQSGADAFAQDLLDILMSLQPGAEEGQGDDAPPEPAEKVMPRRVAREARPAGAERPPRPIDEAETLAV